mmetsp:Transcript_32240/g.23795  ORF Transcript_32240/g.23795 Transcript_32240/m.23795 type:complete len:109 (-) Transcript_32240:21-347(-)
MDHSLKVWDIRPYISGGDDADRLTHTFYGVQHNFERNLLRCGWSWDDQLVAGGSGDRVVYCYDVDKDKMAHRLGGHHGSVNEVQFHPSRNVIASGSSDKTIYIGELDQ